MNHFDFFGDFLIALLQLKNIDRTREFSSPPPTFNKYLFQLSRSLVNISLSLSYRVWKLSSTSSSISYVFLQIYHQQPPLRCWMMISRIINHTKRNSNMSCSWMEKEKQKLFTFLRIYDRSIECFNKRASCIPKTRTSVFSWKIL